MASRRKGRILAFQALYSWEANFKKISRAEGRGHSFVPPELLEFTWLEQEKRAALDEGVSGFSRFLITGTIENIVPVDEMIKNHLENWDFSRLNRVDLAILRISTYTLMFQADVAPSIVINEAIGISKEFGADNSYRFVNGVLDSIKQTLQKNPALPGEPGG
jgi:N utilization substance protein B